MKTRKVFFTYKILFLYTENTKFRKITENISTYKNLRIDANNERLNSIILSERIQSAQCSLDVLQHIFLALDPDAYLFWTPNPSLKDHIAIVISVECIS